MSLFKLKKFTSHSGLFLNWKIDCDALSYKDWKTLAKIISDKYPFKNVYGIPRGGVKLARALQPYIDHSSPFILIVDDVLTTGNSMERMRHQHVDITPIKNIIGVVVFARHKPADWIKPLFTLGKGWN